MHHEHRDGSETDQERADAPVDVVLPEAGADGPLLDLVDRGGQGAGAEQQRQIPRLQAVQPGDLEAAAEHAVDRGDVDDLAGLPRHLDLLAVALDGFALLLDEDHRHGLLEVGLGGLQHVARALAVEAHEDRGLALVETLAGIHQLIAGHDGAPLQQHGLAGPGLEQLATQRRPAGLLGLEGVLFGADQAELEGGGGPQHALGLGRVLHAGQLHHDAVEALALHDRLGDARVR